MFTLPPGMISLSVGGMENLGGTRRTGEGRRTFYYHRGLFSSAVYRDSARPFETNGPSRRTGQGTNQHTRHVQHTTANTRVRRRWRVSRVSFSAEHFLLRHGMCRDRVSHDACGTAAPEINTSVHRGEHWLFAPSPKVDVLLKNHLFTNTL